MAQAKSIESLEEFLRVLETSKLFSAKLIQKLRTELEGSKKKPIDIARMLVKNRKLSNWQAGQLLTGYHKFRQGKFVLRDQLGKSRLGNLFLAHDEKKNQLVAIRSLSKGASANADNVERFVAAAQATIKLKHENLARVLEVSSDGEQHLIVTEYVKGQDLKKQVEEKGPLSVTQAVTYLRQAADALTLAHEKKVVHGSLQPACLLIDSKGVLKIADWGLAPLRDAKQGYCPPEQIDGKPAGESTDLYSLGGTLYYLLSGRVPFAASSPEEEKAIADSQRPIPLNKLRKDIPGPLVDLCNQLLATDPANRLGTMRDVLARFAEVGVADDDLDVADPAADGVSELDDETKSDAPSAVETTHELNRPSVQKDAEENDGSPVQKASADTATSIPVSEAHKTAPISDTVAITISSGKQSTAGPVGAFEISTTRKKKKKTKAKKGALKEKPVAESTDATADEFVTSAQPQVGSPESAPTEKAAKPEKQPAAKIPQVDAPPTPAAPTPAAASPKDKKKPNALVIVIIGLAAVLGLTLLGGGALLMMLLSSKDGKETAAQVIAKTPSPDGSAVDPDPDSEAKTDSEEEIADAVVLVQDDPSGGADDNSANETGGQTPAGDPTGADAEDGVASPTEPSPTPAHGTAAENAGDGEEPLLGTDKPPANLDTDTKTKKPAEDTEEE
jgi:serine/threonine-protein kinase